MAKEMYDKMEFFNSYFGRASEKTIILEEFKKRFSNPSKSKVSVLDLGCHDGTLISKLFNVVQEELKQGVILTGVEPSSEAIKSFSKRSFGPIDVELNLHTLTAESYLESVNDKINYDWVLASQCLYWTQNLESTISKIIKKGSKSLIVLRGHYGIYQIQSEFKNLLGNKNEKLYTSDDIDLVLKALKTDFERQDFQTSIEIPDSSSVEFIWLMSFFLQTTEDRFSSDDISRIKSYLNKLGNPIRHDVSFFWVGL